MEYLIYLLIIPAYFFVKHQKVATVTYQNGKDKQEEADDAARVAEQMHENVRAVTKKITKAKEDIIKKGQEKAKAEGADALATARANESRAETQLRKLELERQHAEVSAKLADQNAHIAKVATHRIGGFYIDFSEILRVYTILFAIPLVGEVIEKGASILNNVKESIVNYWEDMEDPQKRKLVTVVIAIAVIIGLLIFLLNIGPSEGVEMVQPVG